MRIEVRVAVLLMLLPFLGCLPFRKHERVKSPVNVMVFRDAVSQQPIREALVVPIFNTDEGLVSVEGYVGKPNPGKNRADRAILWRPGESLEFSGNRAAGALFLFPVPIGWGRYRDLQAFAVFAHGYHIGLFSCGLDEQMSPCELKPVEPEAAAQNKALIEELLSKSVWTDAEENACGKGAPWNIGEVELHFDNKSKAQIREFLEAAADAR